MEKEKGEGKMSIDFEALPLGIENVFKLVIDDSEYLATRNLAQGISVYGEPRFGRDPEYRVWNPYRSKLAAMILKQMKIPLRSNSRVLYLGGASGTTASHVSDIVSEGAVYAVEFSYIAASALLEVCKHRQNLFPVFADARKPRDYSAIVEQADVIYQDIAQRDQAEIAIGNARHFLRDDGFLIILLKARSVSVAAKPKAVFDAAIEKLREAFEVQEKKTLDPFHKDHLAVIARFADCD